MFYQFVYVPNSLVKYVKYKNGMLLAIGFIPKRYRFRGIVIKNSTQVKSGVIIK